MDNVIGGLKDCFEQPGYATYSHLDSISVVNWPQFSHDLNFCYEFLGILTEPVFNHSNAIWLAWTYLSSSISNPCVSVGFKHILLIYQQSLSSTPAAHRSPWLYLIQHAELWQRTRKVTDIQDYFCSLTDGQDGLLGEVCKIHQLVLNMPATNCTSESLLTSNMYYMCTK